MSRSEFACRAWLITALLLTLAAGARGDDQADRQAADSTDRKPLQTVIPVYPEKARRDRIEGEVQVCFEITRDGRTRRIAVRKSTNRIFEKPALRAVRESTYEPLPDDVELPAIKACRTFRFTLQPAVEETDG